VDELLRLRSEFPILERTTHLISHSLGAMPRGAAARLEEYARLWDERGIRAWAEGWWTAARDAADLLGRIVHAPPGSGVMLPNVSTAVATVLSCLDWSGTRRSVLTCDLEFPSVLYVLDRERSRGADVRVVASQDGLTFPEDAFLHALDESVRLVVLSLVFFKNGALLDVAPVLERARKVGAWVLLDAYQATGTVPVDVQALGCEFFTGGSVKWLCGGPGAGYLFVRPDLLPTLAPCNTGWAAHAEPFAFELPPIRLAADASRMLAGTPAVPAIWGAKGGYDVVLEAGVDRIRAKSIRQTSRLVERAAARGLRTTTPTDPARRGGSIALEVPHGPAVVKELARRDVLVDHRPGAGLRISPHFYTTDDEVDRAIDEIASILETRAYEAHQDATARY